MDEYNSFYHLSKFHHLLVIREREESQEDSLKMRSVENFLEVWLWILRSFLLDFSFSCESEFRKFLNSQTWRTGWTTNFMCGRWNFDQKLKYCKLSILVDSKIRVLVSQLVKLKISKWFFSHVFPLAYIIHNILRIWIWMSRTHFISFWILVIP